MGEETSVRSPRKHSLGHLRAVKQLITVALDLEEVRELILRPLSLFNCIFPGYFMQASKRVRVVKSQHAKRLGHLVKWRSLI